MKIIVSKLSSLSAKKKSWIILGIFLFVTNLVVYGYVHIKGNVFVYTDVVGGDTLQIIFPIFNFLSDTVREWDFSWWTHQFGPGVSFMYFLYYVNWFFDPFSLIIILTGSIFGNHTTAFMLGLMQVLKIFTCGYLCYYYLSLFNFTEKSKIISSYIFAFNGFEILWGQQYFFGFYPICTLLLLINIEKALKKQRLSISLILTVAYLLISSFYMAYMILLCGVIYTIIRSFSLYSKFDLVREMKSCLKVASSFIVGGLISCILSLPSMYFLLNTSTRLQGKKTPLNIFRDTFFSSYGESYNRSTILRLMSNNLEGVGDEWYGGAKFYCTAANLFFTSFSLIIFSLFVYYILKNENKQIKRLYIAGVGLILYFLFNPSGSTIFNGFTSPFDRHTFLMMPFFAFAFSYVIDKLFKDRNIHIPTLFTSAGLSIYFIAKEIYNNKDRYAAYDFSGYHQYYYYYHYFCIFLIAAFVAVIFIINKKKKININICYMALCGIVLLNVTTDSFITTNVRKLVSAESDAVSERREDNDSKKALNYLKTIDSDFYRIESLYDIYCWWHDALILNYNGISAYDNVPNKYLEEFYSNSYNKTLASNHHFVRIVNSPHDIIQYSLLGIKYFLTKTLPPDIENYEIIERFGDVYVVKNLKGQQFAKFYENSFDNNEYLQLSYAQKMNVLSSALVLQENDENTINYDKVSENIDIIDITNEVIAWLRSEEEILNPELNSIILTEPGITIREKDDLVIAFQIDAFKQYTNLYFEFSAVANENKTVNAVIYTGKDFASYSINLQAGKKDTIKYPLPKDSQWIVFKGVGSSISNFKITSNQKEFNTEFIPEISDFQKDAHLVIDINNEKSGYVFIPIPYADGWNAKLNGEKSEIIRADSGFMAIKVDAGKNKIMLDFYPPMLNAGIAVTIFGIFILIAIILFQIIKLKELKKT